MKISTLLLVFSIALLCGGSAAAKFGELNIHRVLKSGAVPAVTSKESMMLGAMAKELSVDSDTMPKTSGNNTWQNPKTNPWLPPHFMEYAPTFWANPGDPSMRTCFTYMVHNEATIKGVIRTIALLWEPKDCFVIHIDQKAWALKLPVIEWLNATENRLPNVHIVDPLESVNVLYAGFQQVEGMLKLQETALKVFQDWDRVLFMGGQHIPLMVKSEMDAYFKARDGLSVIPAVTCNRLTALYDLGNCNRKLMPNGIPYMGADKFPEGGVYFKGLTYTVLARDFVQVGVFENDRLDYFKSYFSKDFTCSDESFFHTLFYTSDFKDKATKDDPFPMYTVFPNPFDTHPAVLDTQTALKLRANLKDKPHLFARKYEIAEADNALSAMFGITWQF